ncbi:MAG: sigma-54-dependent Fis family transcriptional regulator [Deltaproteobacteria bacterium]|nr:sigma-54-dependent Fis family transcriptional regulator [Deltaproteobacteria bacterium]
MIPQKHYSCLFIDDDRDILRTLEKIARENKWSFLSFADGNAALEALDHSLFDAVVVEFSLPGFSGLQILEWLKTRPHQPEVIIVTAKASVDSAVKALKLGAFDYLTKPFETVEKVAFCLRHALEKHELLKKMQQFQGPGVLPGPGALPGAGTPEEFENIIGKSAKMQAIYEMIRHVAASHSNVLIQGESGTGKELVARIIHKNGPRALKPFVVINCSAMPETLLESELFGYDRGSFTGAVADKMGLFEVADGGTVFLDEIGEVPPSVQVKLLRVLQEGEIRPIGATEARIVDVRVIAASNKDLLGETRTGKFREDLYYRLNVIGISLPPLRERSEDVPPLAYYFLKNFSRKMGKEAGKFSLDVLQAFQSYPWPGNVRELENVIERAVVLTAGDTVTAKNIPPKILSASFYAPDNREGDLSQLKYREAKKRALNIFNRSYIIALLEKNGGNITAASEKAGMDRSNFKKIIRKYRVEAKA